MSDVMDKPRVHPLPERLRSVEIAENKQDYAHLCLMVGDLLLPASQRTQMALIRLDVEAYLLAENAL